MNCCFTNPKIIDKLMQTNPKILARTHYFFKIKTFKEALNALILKVSIKSEIKDLLEYQKKVLINTSYLCAREIKYNFI
jgi:hypothetical protein